MTPAAIDIFDPRTFEQPLDWMIVWLDPDNNVYCIVDRADYDWAIKWAWSTTPNSTGRLLYATRSTRLHGAKGPQTKLYMHKEILKRSGKRPPSPAHTVGDHRDGDSLNNRRRNLRWATHSQNGMNRNGKLARKKFA